MRRIPNRLVFETVERGTRGQDGAYVVITLVAFGTDVEDYPVNPDFVVRKGNHGRHKDTKQG